VCIVAVVSAIRICVHGDIRIFPIATLQKREFVPAMMFCIMRGSHGVQTPNGGVGIQGRGSLTEGW